MSEIPTLRARRLIADFWCDLRGYQHDVSVPMVRDMLGRLDAALASAEAGAQQPLTQAQNEIEIFKDFIQSCLNEGAPPECPWPTDRPKTDEHLRWCQRCEIERLLPDRFLRSRDTLRGCQ